MKKVLTLIVIYCFIIASTSCSKKEYVCDCTRTISETGSIPVEEAINYNGYVKSSDAENWCEYYETNTTITNNGITTSEITTCDLK